MRVNARQYSILMGICNFGAMLVLFGLSRVNALAGWPNPFVAVAGPAATIAFAAAMVVWFLDALAPGVIRRRRISSGRKCGKALLNSSSALDCDRVPHESSRVFGR